MNPRDLRKNLALIGDDDLRKAVLDMHDGLEPKMREEPAAKRRHHAWPGGYYAHVEQVTHLGVEFHRTLRGAGCPVPPLDDVILVCFVHDLDKLIRYHRIDPDPFAVTVDANTGRKVEQKVTYKYIERPPFDSSGYVAQECARYGIWLTLDQLHAVSCHHGGWSEILSSPFGGGDPNPLATIIHSADLCSARMWGNEQQPG